MLRVPLLLVLFLPTGVLAQEGAIKYDGQLTMKFSLDFITASMEEEMEMDMDASMGMDSVMADMLSGQMQFNNSSIGMEWESRFSGQAIAGNVNLGDIVSGMAAVMVPDIAHTNGTLEQLGSFSFDFYFDYEAGVAMIAEPPILDERYVITRDIDSLLIPNWELLPQDSTILGYRVVRAVAERKEDLPETIVPGISTSSLGKGAGFEPDSARIEVWFAPDLPTPAAPFMMGGGLPGAVLHMRGGAYKLGTGISIEFSAREILTALDNPVVPLTGTPIEQDDYLEIMDQRIDELMQQVRKTQ